MINLTKIKKEDMLLSWDFSNFLSYSKGQDDFYDNIDWIGFIHPTYGWCHTFDVGQLAKSSNITNWISMPVSVLSPKSDNKKEPIYFQMKFNVCINNVLQVAFLSNHTLSFLQLQRYSLFKDLVAAKNNTFTYFTIYIHEEFATRFEMDQNQMFEVGYEEKLDVKFKKTNLKKIDTKNSKCITDEDYHGFEYCKIKQVKHHFILFYMYMKTENRIMKNIFSLELK